MSPVVSRRNFLVSAAAVGGGLTLGFNLAADGKFARNAKAAPAG
ncbi:MAG: twin-arginine translocation signal domain-containing protein, partial [Alphaproteobacteria bacterium]